MYSGTTFHTKSGRVMGTHQKIDRLARRIVRRSLPREVFFPSIRDILHFEGANGPDGLKRKSPGQDEPWHFLDPEDVASTPLLGDIASHTANLAAALKNANHERAAFEAAWLAHAVTDGLTPAHHYPMEEKLEELRGEGLETRTSKKQKLLMPGKSRRHQLRNNWEFWGAKGVMTTHLGFELGVASASTSLRLDTPAISAERLAELHQRGYEALYLEAVQRIAALDMYHRFSRRGWTHRLARQTREELLPLIVEMVALAWLHAVEQAA